MFQSDNSFQDQIIVLFFSIALNDDPHSNFLSTAATYIKAASLKSAYHIQRDAYPKFPIDLVINDRQDTQIFDHVHHIQCIFF